MALPGSVGHDWPVPPGDSEVTPEELSKLQDCFKDKKFRDLLADYVEELKNPTNRMAYEESLRIAEANQQAPKGKVLVKPTAVFAIKLKISRTRFDESDDQKSESDVKVFVNVCSAKEVKSARTKPTPHSSKLIHTGGGCGRHSHSPGSFWEIPFVIGHQRSGLEREGLKDALVFDVAFNPDTLSKAKHNEQMKEAIIETSMEALRSRLSRLTSDDTKSFKVLKKKKSVGGNPALMSIDESTLQHQTSESESKTETKECTESTKSDMRDEKKKSIPPQTKKSSNDDWSVKAVKTVRKKKCDDSIDSYWLNRVVESSDGRSMYVYLKIPESMNMQHLRMNQERRLKTSIIEPREERRFEVTLIDMDSGEPAQKILSVRLPFQTSTSNEELSAEFIIKSREIRFVLSVDHTKSSSLKRSINDALSLENPDAKHTDPVSSVSSCSSLLIEEITDDCVDQKNDSEDRTVESKPVTISIDQSLIHFRESMENCVIKIDIPHIIKDSLEMNYNDDNRELVIKFTQSMSDTDVCYYSHKWILTSDIIFIDTDHTKNKDIDISDKNMILLFKKKTKQMWQTIEKNDFISQLCDDLSILELD